MILILTLAAAGAPVTVHHQDGTTTELDTEEVFILQLDDDGAVITGPTLDDIIISSFGESMPADWEADIGPMFSFHEELGESQELVASADAGHILGTKDGALGCSCNASCSSEGCSWKVEVDWLLIAGMACDGECQERTVCETDGGADQTQTTTPEDGPTDEDGGTYDGIERPSDYCDTDCEETVMYTDDEGFNEEVIRLLNLWGPVRGPWEQHCD